jgi:glyoxylase-like metal-dependent hydrolase (beta-lactamase superfamily II)
MNWKKTIIVTLIILAVIAGSAAIVFYPLYRFMFRESTRVVDKELTIVQGGGGNSGVLVTDSAVVVIDTKMNDDAAKKLYNLAKTKAGTKKIIVVNTHYHGDHVNGNKLYKGCDIYIGAYDRNFLSENIGPENMPNRFVKDSLVLNLGNEIMCLYNLGQAHTMNDMVVLLKNRKALFTGDLVFYRVNPFLKRESGANVDKWSGALDRLLKMPGIGMVIPGHGESGDRSMIVSMRNYFLDMKEAVANPAKKKELIAKYHDWIELPVMTSPEATIDYIVKTK